MSDDTTDNEPKRRRRSDVSVLKQIPAWVGAMGVMFTVLTAVVGAWYDNASSVTRLEDANVRQSEALRYERVKRKEQVAELKQQLAGLQTELKEVRSKAEANGTAFRVLDERTKTILKGIADVKRSLRRLGAR